MLPSIVTVRHSTGCIQNAGTNCRSEFATRKIHFSVRPQTLFEVQGGSLLTSAL